MTERKPHKWAEVIKAWADGKTIQFRGEGFPEWVDYDADALQKSQISAIFYPFHVPRFDLNFEWRVKPENIVREGEVSLNPYFSSWPGNNNNIRIEFDPDTKKLVKAEVIG